MAWSEGECVAERQASSARMLPSAVAMMPRAQALFPQSLRTATTEKVALPATKIFPAAVSTCIFTRAFPPFSLPFVGSESAARGAVATVVGGVRAPCLSAPAVGGDPSGAATRRK
eukprot:764208-Pleurochrysis_carterae.AAC.1